jgi:hypothetical protein
MLSSCSATDLVQSSRSGIGTWRHISTPAKARLLVLGYLALSPLSHVDVNWGFGEGKRGVRVRSGSVMRREAKIGTSPRGLVQPCGEDVMLLPWEKIDVYIRSRTIP